MLGRSNSLLTAKMMKLNDLILQMFGGFYFPHSINSIPQITKSVWLSRIHLTRNFFISGRYENSKWFNDIRQYLVQEITPKEGRIEANVNLYKIIENENSVCISIRRGDYLSEKYKDCFNVCTKEYFKAAIAIMRKKVENPVFVCFSDEIDWVKNTDLFEPSDRVYYESGNDPVWEKLRLMYLCKHYIIANSTFSWWAQYLSRNTTDKIVIAPDHWFNPNTYWPLLEESFIKIPVE